MEKSRGTEALVALEDAAPDVLFETVPGTDIQLWPLLRWPVARSMAAAELNTHSVRRTATRRDLLERAVRRHLPNPYASSRLRSPATALFVVDGGTFASVPEGRKNWLVDDHALVIPGSVVLQERARDLCTRRADRPTFPRTFSFEDSAADVRDLSRSSPPSAAVVAFAHSAIAEVYRRLEFHVDEAGMAETRRQLMVRLARAPHTLRYFTRIIDRVRPQIAFVQTGSYGDRSHLISALKQHGTHVAEHQHGWIGPSHGAYNFGDAMRHPALARTIPDTLLTFGDFWSRNIRFPGAMVAVGKPHLEMQARATLPHTDRDHVVMIVSSVFAREELTRFALAVRDLLPANWRVTLRPHPSERASVETLYSGLMGEDRVSFDLEPDVYVSLGTVRGVIGLASTVLYEALAMDCKVHVKDSPLADLYIDDSFFGERLTDGASLRRAIAGIVSEETTNSEPNSRGILDTVWKPNTIANFERFVDDVL